MNRYRGVDIYNILDKVERGLLCLSCGYFEKRYQGRYIDRCPVCGGPLVPVVERVPEPLDLEGVWRWSGGLLEKDLSVRVSLSEASTPMIRSRFFSRRLKIRNLFFKDESRNPNSLYMDRGSAYLISVLRSRGLRSVSIVSRGDLAISMATYARRAGVKSTVIMPADTLPSKIYRARLVASRVNLVENFDHAMKIVEILRKRSPERVIVTPTNPYLLNGYQTILYEIIQDLGRPPDLIVLPVGDGALMTSLLILAKKIGLRTRFIGVRAEGSTPLLSEIRAERPLFREYLEELTRDSGHEIVSVSDDRILDTIRVMSREEGLPVDPVNASVAAGLEIALASGIGIENAVLLFTGGGLLHDPAVMKIVLREEKSDKISLGFTKEKILEILLEEGGVSAYRLWRILQSTYGVRISLRTVYNHLRDLVERGLVERTESDEEDPLGRPRRVYVATEDAYYYIMR